MKGDFSRFTFDRRKHYTGVRLQQGRVQLDADWNEQVDIATYLRHTLAADLIGASGAQVSGGGFDITVPSGGGGILISRGRYYVDGILCENEAQDPLAPLPPLPIDEQPDLPPDPETGVWSDSPTGDGSYLTYLDVWQEGVTALDDPDLLEKALGGPDTATRMRTVWQVRLQKLDATATIPTDAAGWRPDLRPQPTLAARSAPNRTPADNQLYRVEVHDAGTADAATFKWSKDNGAAVAQIDNPQASDSTDSHSIRINADLGLGQAGGFEIGQWVEVTDASRILNGEPGVFAKLSNVQGQILHVEGWPGDLDPAPDLPNHPILRRWDSDGVHTVTVPTPVMNGGFLSLDGTVEVHFAEPIGGSGGMSPAYYRTGDYWLIPTRVAENGVLWPQTVPPAPPGPVALPPQGIQHHYALLAGLQRAGGVWGSSPHSYRKVFVGTTVIPGGEKLNSKADDTMSAKLTITGSLEMVQAPLVAATGDTPDRGLRFPGLAAGSGQTPGAFLQYSASGGTPKLTLGAEDGAALALFQGGTELLTLDISGRVGIGVAMPQAPIHLQGDTIVLQGALRYVDATGNGPHAAGQVLTADTAGNATWQVNPARQLGVPVFLDLPPTVGSGTGGRDWTTYSPSLDSVPGNVSALIIEAQGRMDSPDGGAIDAFIAFRKNTDGQQYFILGGRSAAGGDSVGWAGQGLVPMQPGGSGQPGSFQYIVSGPGFNNGWSIRIVGYFP